MAVQDRPVADFSLREVTARLRTAVQAGDEGTVQTLLGELGDHADGIAASADVAAIAVQRDRLDRLSRALRKLDGPAVATGFALGYLADADRRLDRARTRTLGAQAADRLERAAIGVRDRVLALLVEPRRPGDIAASLACDASQVSRALRELQASGDVVRVPAPAQVGGDRRAHWYAQPQMDVTAAA